MSDDHWMEKAVKRPGALHRNLGIPQGEKIPAKTLARAAASTDSTIAKEASLAETFRRLRP